MLPLLEFMDVCWSSTVVAVFLDVVFWLRVVDALLAPPAFEGRFWIVCAVLDVAMQGMFAR